VPGVNYEILVAISLIRDLIQQFMADFAQNSRLEWDALPVIIRSLLSPTTTRLV